MNYRSSSGFTLVELLVVISIVTIISSITMLFINQGQTRGRNVGRISALNSYQTALELYYSDHGSYPIGFVGGGGSVHEGFTYRTYANGSCGDPADVSTDDSDDGYLLFILYDQGYINGENWQDPLNPPNDSNSPYNCMYVILHSEKDENNIQHYLLHCNLEDNSWLEQRDGGGSPTLYEVFSPEPFLCVSHSGS